MPFEGLARNHSAEFIAAQRARSRSVTTNAAGTVPMASSAEGGRPLRERTLSPGTLAAESFNTNATPALFIVPSPVHAVMRNDDNPRWRPKSPQSPGSPRSGSAPSRAVSRGTARGRAVSTAEPIPEVNDAEQPPQTRPSADNGSESDETLADRDRDVERGEEAKGSKRKGSGQEKQQGKDKQEEQKDAFLVTLEGRQHLNPHTWNENYRWFLTALAGLFVLNATFASSGPSQLIPSIITYFNVSQEIGVLTIALFVAGYCVGLAHILVTLATDRPIRSARSCGDRCLKDTAGNGSSLWLSSPTLPFRWAVPSRQTSALSWRSDSLVDALLLLL